MINLDRPLLEIPPWMEEFREYVAFWIGESFLDGWIFICSYTQVDPIDTFDRLDVRSNRMRAKMQTFTTREGFLGEENRENYLAQKWLPWLLIEKPPEAILNLSAGAVDPRSAPSFPHPPF